MPYYSNPNKKNQSQPAQNQQSSKNSQSSSTSGNTPQSSQKQGEDKSDQSKSSFDLTKTAVQSAPVVGLFYWFARSVGVPFGGIGIGLNIVEGLALFALGGTGTWYKSSRKLGIGLLALTILSLSPIPTNVANWANQEPEPSPEEQAREEARQRAIEEHEREYREGKEEANNRLIAKAPKPDDAFILDMEGPVSIPQDILQGHEEGYPIFLVYSYVGDKKGRGHLPQSIDIDGETQATSGAKCIDISNLAKDGSINVQWNNPSSPDSLMKNNMYPTWIVQLPFISNQCTVSRIED